MVCAARIAASVSEPLLSPPYIKRGIHALSNCSSAPSSRDGSAFIRIWRIGVTTCHRRWEWRFGSIRCRLQLRAWLSSRKLQIQATTGSPLRRWQNDWSICLAPMRIRKWKTSRKGTRFSGKWLKGCTMKSAQATRETESIKQDSDKVSGGGSDVLACGLGCGPDDLWDYDDIATYMKISSHTVSNQVVLRPGFPKAFVPTGRGGKAEKRYFAREVIDFAKGNRQ